MVLSYLLGLPGSGKSTVARHILNMSEDSRKEHLLVSKEAILQHCIGAMKELISLLDSAKVGAMFSHVLHAPLLRVRLRAN